MDIPAYNHLNGFCQDPGSPWAALTTLQASADMRCIAVCSSSPSWLATVGCILLGRKKVLPVWTSRFYCPVADAIGYENYYSRELNRSNSSPAQTCGMMKRWVANFSSQNRYFSIWTAMYDDRKQDLESYYFLHRSKRRLRINKYNLTEEVNLLKPESE